jgi:sodium/hydrogen antiporter
MIEQATFTLWCVVVGLLLIAMTLGNSFIARLPLSAAMLYLAVGYAIGPAGLRLIDVDPTRNAIALERICEIAVLISLFTAGLKLKLPWKDKRWHVPARLASISMMLTVGGLALAGVYLLGLPIGAAVLLGAILAPTDPVLASDVQLTNADDRDRLRFGLTGEGGLNDGTAFPFVMLGLGLLGLHDLGAGGWRWWTIDVAWAVSGGLAIGYGLGRIVGHSVLILRTRHAEALGADEFIAFGLIALAYGVAQGLHTYGFLAVFAAGFALRRMADEHASGDSASAPRRAAASSATAAEVKAMPADLMSAVEDFNAQLERFAEVAVVIAIGALLAVVPFRREVLWLIPLLFLVIRPLSVYAGLAGAQVTGTQKVLMSWFGIRGVGSMYYLMFAITHGVAGSIAADLISLTIAVIVASIVLHGVSVTPLMNRYERLRRDFRML